MESLHPRIRLVWATLAVLSGLISVLVLAVIDRELFSLGIAPAILAGLVVVVLGVVYAVLSYRIWGFALQDDALALEHGVITRVETVVPYVRIQHIDTQRTAIDRMSGLARVVVYTAGSRGSDVTIPGLAPDRARSIQQRLRDRAGEDEADAV